MSLLMLALCTIAFIGYNFVVQWYISVGIITHDSLVKRLLYATAINLVIFSLFLYFPGGITEVVAMFLFYLCTYLLIRKIYNAGTQVAWFTTLSFAVNLFAIRMLVKGAYTLITGVTLNEISTQTYHTLLVGAIAFAIPIPYILFISIFVRRDVLGVILIDKNNMLFSNAIMFVTYIYMGVGNLLVIPFSESAATPIISLFIGFGTIVIYCVTLYYTLVFSNLKLNVDKFDKLSEVVAVEERELRELKESATTDAFTGLKQRSTVEEVVGLFLEQHRGFFVVLFDIDGLKIANDKYGHDEGDFYIKMVARILSSTFGDDTVARIGGDEFMVVGKSDDEHECMKKILTCYRKVKSIHTEYQKPYETSVSYGVVMIPKGIDKYENFNDIYRLSDKRMYAFKRAAKKERKA